MFYSFSFSFNNLWFLVISTMERLPIKQCFSYENGRSHRNAIRALRDLWGKNNQPIETASGKIVRKFNETGSVADVKTPLCTRLRRSAEDFAASARECGQNSRYL